MPSIEEWSFESSKFTAKELSAELQTEWNCSTRFPKGARGVGMPDLRRARRCVKKRVLQSLHGIWY